MSRIPSPFHRIDTAQPGISSLRVSRFIPDHGKARFAETGRCLNAVITGTLFRSLPGAPWACAFYPLGARSSLNFANSSRSLGGTQTCELPSGSFLLAQVGAKNARRRDSRKVLPALCLDLTVTSSLGNRQKIDKLAIVSMAQTRSCGSETNISMNPLQKNILTRFFLPDSHNRRGESGLSGKRHGRNGVDVDDMRVFADRRRTERTSEDARRSRSPQTDISIMPVPAQEKITVNRTISYEGGKQ
ncbi:MAG: hypothetical protein A4E62_01174 [Syntrophorhabdus sp. PtaU1.Bin002]|nr:MAG: hypothetical protein A4E58_02298 [Syntrophorhabdus sp. PtaB.Bin006]OPY71652.1 MAG: hypothetical protein A4E62_01174 [Syntrophorhabdus sp. PtaU1.Bin002]